MYDVAIIGAGPAGYTASIYASRYKLSNVIVGEVFGGQTAESTYIENYPTYLNIKGSDLMGKMRDHARHYNVEEVFDIVESITGEAGNFITKTKQGQEIQSKAIILALGGKRKSLGVEGEIPLVGKGVAYCTTCDAPFFKDKIVGIVGGSDAANTSSLYLSDVASKVYQIYRGDKLRGEPLWAEQVMNDPKVLVLFNTNITKITGTEKLESVTLDKEFEGSTELKLDGLFIEVGSEPVTALSNGLGMKLDETGRIVVGPDQKTNVEGIWAAGDITTNSDNFNQIITAAAEGAIAARNVFTYIKNQPSNKEM
ncbi:MAG: FAD-dependent oxidoreductase [bacterium]